LATYGNIEIEEETNGSVNIWLGSQILVYRDTNQQLVVKDIPNSEAKLHTAVWASNNMDVDFQSGKMGALLLVRDEVIPELMNGLDEFTRELVAQVNAVHQTGYGMDGSTGLNFFNSATTGAKDISLALEVSQDAQKIAASADGSAGNGDTAQAISNLQNELVMDDGNTTLNGYYAGLAADLGSLKQIAEDELAESEVAMQQMENWKTSAEGVSLDEEMANLVRFQHAFTAMAKYMSAIDDMIGVVIAMI
jgi:flagellar hook-associated protein 1 FlgK